jgi:diadenosine tetraphosphate (Ap4A) HIT family hydrolase
VQFLADMALLGDVVLEATQAMRMNYEILGNSEPELHAHIFPRYATEPDDLRRRPAWFYDWKAAPKFDLEKHGTLMAKIRGGLEKRAILSK